MPLRVYFKSADLHLKEITSGVPTCSYSNKESSHMGAFKLRGTIFVI